MVEQSSLYGPADEIGEVVAAWAKYIENSPLDSNNTTISMQKPTSNRDILKEMVKRTEFGLDFANYWIDAAEALDQPVAEIIRLSQEVK